MSLNQNRFGVKSIVLGEDPLYTASTLHKCQNGKTEEHLYPMHRGLKFRKYFQFRDHFCSKSLKKLHFFELLMHCAPPNHLIFCTKALGGGAKMCLDCPKNALHNSDKYQTEKTLFFQHTH